MASRALHRHRPAPLRRRRRRVPRLAVRLTHGSPRRPEGELRRLHPLPPLGRAAHGRRRRSSCSTRTAPIECQPLLDPIDPDVWDAVFPPDTPVRGPRAARLPQPALAHVPGRRAPRRGQAAPPRARCSGRPDLAAACRASHPLDGGDHGLGRRRRGPHRREYDESRVHDDDFDELLGETGPGEDRDVAGPSSRRHRRPAATTCSAAARHASCTGPAASTSAPSRSQEYQRAPRPRGATPPRPPRPGARLPRALLAGRRPPGPAAQARPGHRPRGRRPRPAARRASGCRPRIAPAGDTTACRHHPHRAARPPATTSSPCPGPRTGPGTAAGSATPTASRCSTWTPTAPRSSSTATSGPSRACCAIEENGDPVHAAPTALRSHRLHRRAPPEGASRPRTGCGSQLDARQRRAPAATQPLLDTEDVTRGMRVEVWDDTAKALVHPARPAHRRRGRWTTARSLDDRPEEGFIQGTTATETPDVDDSPVHVHEAVFGWRDGASARARPGKRVRHEDGERDRRGPRRRPRSGDPLLVTSRASQPGTLPRLRYGRSYAFRAWAVDLAGNSRPTSSAPSRRLRCRPRTPPVRRSPR